MNKITIKQASEIMGKSEQFIRIGIERGILPIGACVRNGSRASYYISPKLFYEFTGYKEETLPTWIE